MKKVNNYLISLFQNSILTHIVFFRLSQSPFCSPFWYWYWVFFRHVS